MAPKIARPTISGLISDPVARSLAREKAASGKLGHPEAKTSPVSQRPQRTFIDTNIFVYCDDPADIRKQDFALNLVIDHLNRASGVVSLQVLQEYFVNATRKLKLDPALARRKVEAYTHFQVVVPSANDIFAAIDFHRLHQVSYWDALILHSARQSGCAVLLTEDMQHGRVIDGVRIVNPFL